MERERLGSFEQMKVWQEAHQLVLKILDVTPGLPPEQQDGIALSMEKIAIEVPKTIAEGFRRRGSRNKAHYYNVAQSHLEALRYFLILCRDLKYPIDYSDLSHRADTVARMLDSLVRSMSRQEPGRRGRGRRRGGRHPESDSSDSPRSRDDHHLDEPATSSSRAEVADSDIGTGD